MNKFKPVTLAVLSTLLATPWSVNGGPIQSDGAPASVQVPHEAAELAAPESGIANREDVRNLPGPLKEMLVELDKRPHTAPPMPAFAEADDASQLFMYYLLDTSNFEPNPFTAPIPGINDEAIQTGANAANGGLPTMGAVRLVLEPKPGLPTDPNDPRAFIDMFTDISGLFVINNEAGWYEGWMIHELKVPNAAEPRADGSPRFGTITAEDATTLAEMGNGNNVPGAIFTVDGNEARLPSRDDRFPTVVNNTLPLSVSIGAYNSFQQSDAHSYWEFNAGTNWSAPLYEVPFSGGSPGALRAQYLVNSLIPGDVPDNNPIVGPVGAPDNDVAIYGDDPLNPRDPDRTEGELGQAEFRNRFVPSGLTREILVSAFMRPRSFEPEVTSIAQRLLLAYAHEIARVDQNGDGVISFAEADVNGSSDGLPNTRLYIAPTEFNRFAVTREINDGLLSARFAPGQRGYVASGDAVLVDPSVPASMPRDADDR